MITISIDAMACTEIISFHFNRVLIKCLHTTVMLKYIVESKPDNVFIFDNLTLFFPVLDEIKTRYLYLDKT